jgi:hypothetical protein
VIQVLVKADPFIRRALGDIQPIATQYVLDFLFFRLANSQFSLREHTRVSGLHDMANRCNVGTNPWRAEDSIDLTVPQGKLLSVGFDCHHTVLSTL